MNGERRSLHGVALLLLGLLVLFNIAAAQEPSREARTRRGTVQSELDYLRAAKLPISVELTQATIRQTYDAIAGKAGLNVTYEGAVNGDSKNDVSFKNTTLKDVLGKLGETLELSYRVDGPDKRTVIGASSK